MLSLDEIEKRKKKLAKEYSEMKFRNSKIQRVIEISSLIYLDAFDAAMALMLEREKVAKDFIGQLSFGLLPNGDHVDGATMEYAEKILERLK